MMPECDRAGDTVLHSWEVLANILSSDKTADILCDIGMYAPPPFPSLPSARWKKLNCCTGR